MPVYLLDEELAFPPPEGATPEGIVAVGGDVRAERLILAYASGIFPWPVEGYPLLWFSPDPRFALRPEEVHVGRTLRKQLRKSELRISLDEAFTEVIDACAHQPRSGQDGTWITDELRHGYVRLHQLGFAHSVEAWRDDELVGGLYGVSLGGAFFGESMFSRRSGASKVAFVTLCASLVRWGFDFVDCQVHTPHLQSLGATEWRRADFLAALAVALQKPTRRGPWTLGCDDPLAILRAS
jgi:leucyl/phenylalanyl-tRNA---protein transferase